ncbi:hypothetical protein BZA77DRAFT_386247 [Pyronema omphalodes]|nr:hypothetical protein BZA77DRAFT_386247 [Pyronema omphalodes]
MVSGIEITGLLVGAIPLLLEGAKVYLDGSKKIVDIWDWRAQSREIITDLIIECSLFDLACVKIYQELSDAESMEGKKEIWETSDFEAKLINHMGEPIAMVFLGQVKKFIDLLEVARNELGLDYITLKDLEQPEDAKKRRALDKARQKIIKSIISDRDMLKDIKKINGIIERFAKLTPRYPQQIQVSTTLWPQLPGRMADARDELGLDYLTLKDLKQPEDAEKRRVLDKAREKIMKTITSNSNMLEDIDQINGTTERYTNLNPPYSQKIQVSTTLWPQVPGRMAGNPQQNDLLVDIGDLRNDNGNATKAPPIASCENNEHSVNRISISQDSFIGGSPAQSGAHSPYGGPGVDKHYKEFTQHSFYSQSSGLNNIDPYYDDGDDAPAEETPAVNKQYNEFTQHSFYCQSSGRLNNLDPYYDDGDDAPAEKTPAMKSLMITRSLNPLEFMTFFSQAKNNRI